MQDSNFHHPQATNEDYRGSGWARGHMARHLDMKWKKEAAFESDYFTNICPQNKKMNGGIWLKIENKVRKLALQYDSVNIVCGPIFIDSIYGTIGYNKVAVPDFFFKTVLAFHNCHYHAIAFICPNDDRSLELIDVVTTVNYIESLTNFDLYKHLDDSIEESVEDVVDRSIWGL